MRNRLFLLAAGVLTVSLAPIISEQASAAVQIYDWTTIAGLATHTGSANGTNSAARFDRPVGVAVDTNGNLYVGDQENDTIRKITPVGTNWVATTIAGLVETPGSADGTNNTARFSEPSGVAVDTNGNLYVADRGSHTIRKITPVATNWVTTTIAGLAAHSGSDDGTNSTARFNEPAGVAVDTNGNLYVVDLSNYTIRKITPVGTNWVTTTIAGLALNAGSADGTNSTARFDTLFGVTVGTNDNVYVVDYGNSTVRKITSVVGTTNWVTSTISGLATNWGSADGTNSAARFNFPGGIAADTNGNLYVADNGNSTIRKITPVGANWVTSTIGGSVTNSGIADGLDGDARFDNPFGIAVDNGGNLYVADTWNQTIRLGVPWGTLTITKETAKLNFAKTNSDSCTLTATLDLDASYNLTNAPVLLDIGGADASFTLDAKGKGHGAGTNGTSGTCKLSYKKKTGPWTFTAKLKNGPWTTPWAAYGLSNTTTTVKAGVPVTLPVTLVIGDEGFTGEKALLYKAKTGKSGSAK
jgi:hypothetical protein